MGAGIGAVTVRLGVLGWRENVDSSAQLEMIVKWWLTCAEKGGRAVLSGSEGKRMGLCPVRFARFQVEKPANFLIKVTWHRPPMFVQGVCKVQVGFRVIADLRRGNPSRARSQREHPLPHLLRRHLWLQNPLWP